MVEWPPNHRKTIEINGLGTENHSMVMIEWPQNHRKTFESNCQWAENIKWKWLAPKKNIHFQWVPYNNENNNNNNNDNNNKKRDITNAGPQLTSFDRKKRHVTDAVSQPTI